MEKMRRKQRRLSVLERNKEISTVGSSCDGCGCWCVGGEILAEGCSFLPFLPRRLLLWPLLFVGTFSDFVVDSATEIVR